MTRIGPLEVDDRRIALYLEHLHKRGLARDGESIDARGYASFFVASCVDGFEIRYFIGGRDGRPGHHRSGRALVVGGVHRLGSRYEALSLGTYSILTQIALARKTGLDWVYLGLAIKDCAPMSYKTRFLPHERRIGGVWRRFEPG